MSNSSIPHAFLNHPDLPPEMTVGQFAVTYFVSNCGLEPWAQLPMSEAAKHAGFWEQLLRSFVLLPPLAAAMARSRTGLLALTSALNQPDIRTMAAMTDSGSRGTSIDSGPAFLVLDGMRSPACDRSSVRLDAVGWNPVYRFATSRENAAEVIDSILRRTNPALVPLAALSEKQLRECTVQLHRVAIGQLPETSAIDC